MLYDTVYMGVSVYTMDRKIVGKVRELILEKNVRNYSYTAYNYSLYKITSRLFLNM